MNVLGGGIEWLPGSCSALDGCCDTAGLLFDTLQFLRFYIFPSEEQIVRDNTV